MNRTFALVHPVVLVLVALFFVAATGQEADSENRPSVKASNKVARAVGKQADSSERPKADKKAPAPETSEHPSGPISAIVGATIYTMNGDEVIRDGVILVQDGNVLRVGDASVDIPQDSERIDATGHIITPGWIDADSTLWLTPASASSSASDASLKIRDGLDTFSEDWNEVVRHGVTSVYLQPNGRGTLGGFGILVSTAGDTDGSVQIIGDDLALQASLGVGASNNQTRAQQYERTKKALEAAQEYQEKWDKYNEYLKKKSNEKGKHDSAKPTAEEKAKPSPSPAQRGMRRGPPSGGPPGRGRGIPGRRGPSRGDSGNSSSDSKDETAAKDADKGAPEKEKKEDKPPKKPDRDPIKDQLVKVLTGELPLRLEIHSADDAHFANKLMGDFEDLAVVLEGLSNLGSAAEQVASEKLPVVLGPWLGETTSSSPTKDWANLFGADHSLVISTASATPRGSSLLREHVSASIAAGISPERALAAVTCNAAQVLGVAEQVGSIEAGKRADLVAFAGSPFDSSTPIAKVWSGGVLAHTSSIAPTLNSTLPLAELSDLKLDTLPHSFRLKSQRCMLADGTLSPRIIEISDGVITSISNDVSSEKDLLDLGNGVITPGLFSASTSLGINSRIDPTSLSDAAYVVAADAISGPVRTEMKWAKDGFLRALLSPGNGTTIAGTASLIRIGINDNSDRVLEREAAAKFVLLSGARSQDRFPSSLAGQLQFIRQSLAGTLAESRLFLPETILERLATSRKERFAAIRTGQMPVHVYASEDAEIRGALDLIEQFQLQATLVGPNQLRPFAKRILATNAEIIALPASATDYQWYLQDLVEAASQGIPIGLAGNTATELRHLASDLVEQGLDRNLALKTLCQGTPRLQVPGIEVGAPADLVIWTDSPVNLSASPICVLAGGRPIAEED